MALDDICLSASDSQISVEVSRGNIGTISDINFSYLGNAVEEITAVLGGGPTYFAFG